LHHDKVRAELHDADALIVPSRTTTRREAEGIPVAPKEAFATGLPVIATTCGGLPETVPPGQRAGLVPENDPRALGEAIVALLDEPGAWQARAAEGRRWVEQHFDADRLACRLADVYRDAAAGAEAGAWPSAPQRGHRLARTAIFVSSHRSSAHLGGARR
jgi:glycosyltransferase involved in cell wall biosynthesis